MDDLERILARAEEQRRPQFSPDAIGCPAFVGRVTSSGANLAVGKFLLVNPTVVMGPEVEGGPATMLVDTAISIPVYLVGPGVPATGDYVRVRWTDHRWETTKRYMGGTTPPLGVNIPGCFCQGTPQTLNLTVSFTPPEDAAYYGYQFQDSVLAYYPNGDPPYMSQWPKGPGYYSTQAFAGSSPGSYYYYKLSCVSSQYSLGHGDNSGTQHPYQSSPGLIFNWSMGGKDPVNYCSPFGLYVGRAQQGVPIGAYFTITG